MKGICFIAALFLGTIVSAQETAAGPVIKDFGKVYKVAPDFEVDKEMEYKVVFDIVDSPDSKTELNPGMNTPARFLNMNGQSGVSVEKMSLALVVHGGAFKDILNDTAYAERYQTANPNTELIQALLSSGVEIILCGQTAGHRKVSKEDMIPGVKLALSAMNALVQLQNQNYQLIKF
ncbi:MAG: DsrE family protein [Pricia sp.]